MNLLALDTSTSHASVALAMHGVTYFRQTNEVDEHARGILGLIQSLLDEADCSIAQLDGIVFGRGPGSFTGLRIACSVAKGLAYAHDLLLYPVSGLAAIAHRVQHTIPNSSSMPVLVMLDARMQQLYWALFNVGHAGVLESVSNAADISVPAERSFILAGAGWETYLPQMSNGLLDRVQQYVTQYPNAIDLIDLVESGTISAVSIASAQPVYIRNQVTHGAK